MHNQAEQINKLLQRHKDDFHPVVPFSVSDHFIPLDFTSQNRSLSLEIVSNTDSFSEYIEQKLKENNAKYGLGGYMEHRTVYARSSHFDTQDEPRRLHLGVDIWGESHTPVYAFMEGKVHSFAFNNHYGDYGATIILQHQLEEITFFSLYGHLSLKDLEEITIGQKIKQGQQFAHFGIPAENGAWPPHLHFQLMINMDGLEGDYPGVAKFSEKELWLNKIPDPNIILNTFFNWETL